MLPLASAPHAEAAARKIASDPGYDLWQPHFSPNGRWIVFNAVANSPTALESAIYVVPLEGGPWTRITEGEHWGDKPRWSPDGKTIYFISGVGGFFNIWGIHFDPAKGKPVGEPFRVSEFERPSFDDSLDDSTSRAFAQRRQAGCDHGGSVWRYLGT